MNEVLFSFEPNTSELSTYLFLGIGLFILCSFLFIYALIQNKKLLLLFAGFLGIIALGTSIFSGLTQQKLTTVQIYKNGISTPHGEVTFDNIRSIKMEQLKEHSKYPVQRDGEFITIDTANVILVEENNGKIHLLSEDNYPLTSIYKELAILVNQWREENPPVH